MLPVGQGSFTFSADAVLLMAIGMFGSVRPLLYALAESKRKTKTQEKYCLRSTWRCFLAQPFSKGSLLLYHHSLA